MLTPSNVSFEFKPLTGETFLDAESVVRRTFVPDALRVLKKILENPYARSIGVLSYGDIGYEQGKPAGFQGIILRKMYFGQAPFSATGASTLGMIEGASPWLLLAIIKKMTEARDGRKMGFGNTTCRQLERMSRKYGFPRDGGITWKKTRFSVIHPFALIAVLLCKKVLRVCPSYVSKVLSEPFEVVSGRLKVVRLRNIDKPIFDRFWTEYISQNRGLVCSRAADELQWMFGDSLELGKDVLLCAMIDLKLVGYIILRNLGEGRWKVADLIALGNDVDIIRRLLWAAKRFLRKRTNALILSIRGFPQKIYESVVPKLFPLVRVNTQDPFTWEIYDEELRRKLGDLYHDANSWFFGPYDGDADL